MGKYCGGCGTPLNPEDKFCGSCGAAVKAKQPAAPAQTVAISTPKPVKKPRRRGAFPVLALLVAAALGAGFLPHLMAGNGTAPVTVERNGQPLAVQTASEATAVALRQYVYARLATEAFATADLQGMSMAEIQVMVEDATRAWEEALFSASVAEEIAMQAVEVLEASANSGSGASGAPRAQLMALTAAPLSCSFTAYADDGPQAFDPKAWAEKMTRQFDALKGANRYHQLAKQLGTDAKAAYEQMTLAQGIIHNQATADAAFWDKMTKAAQATKAASKVGLVGISMVATGGGSVALLEGAGLLVGGVDCIVDVAETGSTIILGDGNQVAVAFGDIKEKLGPVSSLVGLATLNPSGIGTAAKDTTEALVYITDSLVDLFYEDKIMGIKVEGLSHQTLTVSAQVFESGAKAALDAAGYKLPQTDALKALADILNDWKPDREVTIARLDALSAQMAAIQQNPDLYEETDGNGLEAIPESELEAWESALAEREGASEEGGAEMGSAEAGNTPTAGASWGNLSGSYSCELSGPIYNKAYRLTIVDNGNGNASVSNDNFWADSEGSSYEARYNADSGAFDFAWFDASFSFEAGNITAAGEFFVEGQRHTVSLRRVSD